MLRINKKLKDIFAHSFCNFLSTLYFLNTGYPKMFTENVLANNYHFKEFYIYSDGSFLLYYKYAGTNLMRMQ